MQKQVVCIVLAVVTAVAIFSSTSLASAFVPTGGNYKTENLDLFSRATVICEKRKEGTGTRVFSCPDGNTCLTVSGVWKCKPAGVAPMSCAACARNQNRDGDACGTSGDLIAQNQCINRVNAEYIKCIPGCSSP